MKMCSYSKVSIIIERRTIGCLESTQEGTAVLGRGRDIIRGSFPEVVIPKLSLIGSEGVVT